MHLSALYFGELFRDTYCASREPRKILDVGSYDVNGSLRQYFEFGQPYIGLDFAEGPGVDLVLQDPYHFPIEENSIDICVSSSCFEHSEFFWLTFLEIMRVLKPGGLFYLNAPSNGMYHAFPFDFFRFYPDAGIAMQNWGRRNEINVTLLESFIGYQSDGMWNDFVAVFIKDESFHLNHPHRMIDRLENVTHERRFIPNL